MQPETKSCQNCKKEFTIEVEDFSFYEKINVPAPTWCPKCRLRRRWSFANTWSLFWRNCDKCGVKTMSVYSPKAALNIFCPKCWWADDWDGTEYAMDYDPARPFFEQLKELSDKTPYASLESSYSTLKNCNYCNALAWCKDSYQIFWADYCENAYYSSILNGLKWSSDCMFSFSSELCYGSVRLKSCYKTFFSTDCDDSVDVWFSRNCYGCTNCIGCVNLRGASYSIFNIKYTKEEYEKKVKEMKLDTWQGIKNLEKKAYKFWAEKPFREYSGNTKNLNSTGERIYSSKNSKECYMVGGVENCKWCQIITVKPAKDCYDYSGWGNNAELVYESVQCGENINNIKFSTYCFPDCINLEYCNWSTTGKNNFGCINLKRKSYCILNKQYSKEEYEKLRLQIIEDMKKNPYIDNLGRKIFYGDFFPVDLTKFAYNKSNAMRFFPLKKEDALSMGYVWDDDEGTGVAHTIKAQDLPETINDTTEEILKEVIECNVCKRSYRITNGELDILKKLGLPVPHECPKCRENERFNRMTKPDLYNRTCMKCNTKIYTPYKPEDPRILYCVKCYQAEFA